MDEVPSVIVNSKIEKRLALLKLAFSVLIYKNEKQRATLFDLAASLVDTPNLVVASGQIFRFNQFIQSEHKNLWHFPLRWPCTWVHYAQRK